MLCIGGGVKSFCIVLIVLCELVAGNAVASNWVKAVEGGTSKIFVDLDSINKTGNIVAAWYRRDFKHPMHAENKRRPYQSSKVLNYYNCSDNEIAAAQWITYEKTGGQGKIITNERVSSLEYGDIPLGETGKPLFDFICQHAHAR